MRVHAYVSVCLSVCLFVYVSCSLAQSWPGYISLFPITLNDNYEPCVVHMFTSTDLRVLQEFWYV